MITLENRDGISIIWLDTEDRKVNTLNIQALRDLEAAFSEVQGDSSTRAVVLLSRKPANFLAGVDISLFTSLTPEELRSVTLEGQNFFNRIENFPKPVVAGIHGGCAGGGTELVLACHYRLASDHPATHFALPEVQLGLLPGLGGTQRLPALVGLQKGLELVLTGRKVFARQARRLGLVDALHHPEGLHEATLEAARALTTGEIRHRTVRRRGPAWLLERPPASQLVYRQAAAQASRQGRGNYPAPGRIIEAVRIGREHGLSAGLQAEAAAFSELASSGQAQALMHVFFARSATRHNPFEGNETDVSRVAVLGAGLMGAGIAQVSAAAGLKVTLSDQSLDHAARGRGNIHRDISRRVGRGLSTFERDRTMERIRLADSVEAAGAAQLTIEAVPEQLELKQSVLTRVEAVTPDSHVFASNTSSIPISQIAAASARPRNVVGMHYFSPVPKMPLLEVVQAETSSQTALATAVAVGLQQGKCVIVVQDRPGFYVNRVLAPYISEALRLVEEGAKVEQVDGVMRDAGFPVGPLKLIDEVGLDVAGSVNAVLAPLFAERGLELASAAPLLEAGLKGRKGGRGFYLYEGGKSGRVNPDVYRLLGAGGNREMSAGLIRRRLLWALVNEAAHTLEEGIIRSPLDGDAGAVFGFGFPPFLGGPFWFMDQQGLKLSVADLEDLQDTFGPRFEPAGLLRRMAARDERFFGKGREAAQESAVG